jgi:hypothetical protein
MMKTTKKLKNNSPKTNGALAEPVKQPAFKAESVKAAPSQAELLKPAPMRPEPIKAAVVRPEPAKLAPIKTEAPKPVQLKAEPVPAPVAKPAPVQPEPPAVKRVPLQLEKPGAKSVCVAGSFNGWNPAKTPLKDAGNGKWVGELTGISGRHEYMFVVDGQWLPDPNARETVQNPFGGRNSVLVVSA